MSGGNIKVDNVTLPLRIEDVKKIGEELVNISNEVSALPFMGGVQQSYGPQAAVMRDFQNYLIQIIGCGKELTDATASYLQKSYDTFVDADTK